MGSSEHYPLARLLSVLLRSLLEDLHEELAAEGFKGLRPAYGYALYAIDSGATTAVELGSQLGMTKQGAAKLLEALEADGYVRRVPHPDDGRARLLVLTARGRRLLEASTRAQQRLEERWADVLGRRAAAGLRSQLEAIVEARGAGASPLRPPW